MKKKETLILDTASRINTLAIFSENKKIYEKIWGEKAKEAKILLKIFHKKKILPESIVVVRGPGNFTSCRVGVVIANLLAFAFKSKIFGISVFDFWRERMDKSKNLSQNNSSILRSFDPNTSSQELDNIPILPNSSSLSSNKNLLKNSKTYFGKDPCFKKYLILVSAGKGKLFVGNSYKSKARLYKKEEILKLLNKNKFTLCGEISEQDRSFFSDFDFANESDLFPRAESILLASSGKIAYK